MSILIKTSRRPIMSSFRGNKPTIRPPLDNDNRRRIKTMIIASRESFKNHVSIRLGSLDQMLVLPTWCRGAGTYLNILWTNQVFLKLGVDKFQK